MLTYFVNHAAIHYGPTFTVYNIHSLIHIADDAELFNATLDEISSFPFDNYMQTLKRYVRNATNPLVSIVKRVTELDNAGVETDYKQLCTIHFKETA